MNRWTALLTSKTFWAGVIAAGGFLLQAPHIGLGEVLIAVGMVAGAAGIKDNFVKLGVD